MFLCELGARTGKVFFKNGAVSSFDDLCPKEKKEFQASTDLFHVNARCGACSGFGVSVRRVEKGHWVVKRLMPHSLECKGGNFKGCLALEAYTAAVKAGDKRRARGANPHHRMYPFEVQYFVKVVQVVIRDDLQLNKRGHATASVDSIKGLLEAFMPQEISTSLAKRCRAVTLEAMYGNAKEDITLMPGIQLELERCGFDCEVLYKNKLEMVELTVAAQKVK